MIQTDPYGKQMNLEEILKLIQLICFAVKGQREKNGDVFLIYVTC